MGWSCREEWDMEIRRLNQKDYAGRKFTARYQTNGYYEICASEQGFRLSYRLFPAPVGRSFDDVFFGEWLEAPGDHTPDKPGDFPGWFGRPVLFDATEALRPGKNVLDFYATRGQGPNEIGTGGIMGPVTIFAEK